MSELSFDSAASHAEEAVESPPALGKWSQRFAAKKPPPAGFVPDPAATSWQLDNGLRFLLSPQPDQPGEVSLRLIVLVGSMHETEAERGFAHFVEHLAFMGRRSRPQGGSMEEFQRLGLSMGADSNASTSRDHTLYQIDLPANDDATLEESLHFLRDVADGLLFRPEDVESERRVVLREQDERQKSEAFTLQARAILPKVPAAGLPPGGLNEVIERATPSQLRSFWERHYLASRMALAVVGDFQTEAMSARLRRHFDSLPKRDAPANPLPGDPLDPHRMEVRLIPHPADDRVTITIAAPWPLETQPYSPAIRRRDQLQTLASKMLVTRLSRDSAGHKNATASAEGDHVSLIHGVGWSEIEVSTNPQLAVSVLESSLKDFFTARDGGFTDREFAEAKGEVASSVRGDFIDRLSNRNSSQAELLADSFLTSVPVESPEDELNRDLSYIASISKAECELALRRDWRDEILRILVAGSVSEKLESSCAKALARASAKPRVGPDAKGIEPLEIDSFGPPGVVLRQKLDEKRGFLEAEFANGVVARLQPMPALGGMVAIEAHLGYGLMSVPKDRPGLGAAASLLLDWYPLESHEQLGFQAALADLGLSSDFTPLPATFSWDGISDRASLEQLLQVTCARIARPGLAIMEQRSLGTPHTRAILEKREKLVTGFDGELDRLMEGDDPRLDFSPVDLLARDSSQVAEWLVPILQRERLCVLIAGDFEPEEALRYLAASFGALPHRQAWDTPSPYPPLVETPPGRHVCGETPDLKLGTAGMAFAHGPLRKASDSVSGELLQQLIEIRLSGRLRDEQGESYSPYAYQESSPDQRREWMILRADTKSGRSEAVAESLRGLIGEIQRGEWSKDEFQRALRPLGPAFRKECRSPWDILEHLLDPTLVPVPDDLEPARLALLEPEVRELAKAWLGPEFAIELRTEPGDQVEEQADQ